MENNKKSVIFEMKNLAEKKNSICKSKSLEKLNDNINELFYEEKWNNISEILHNFDNIDLDEEATPTNTNNNIEYQTIINNLRSNIKPNSNNIYDNIDNVELLLILLPRENNEQIKTKYTSMLIKNINKILNFDENDVDKRFCVIGIIQKLIDTGLFNLKQETILIEHLMIQNNHFNDDNKMLLKKVFAVSDQNFNKLTIKCNEYKIDNLKKLYSEYLINYSDINTDIEAEKKLSTEITKIEDKSKTLAKELLNENLKEKEIKLEFLNLLKEQIILKRNQSQNIYNNDSFSTQMTKWFNNKKTSLKSNIVDTLQLTAEGFVTYKLVGKKGIISKLTAIYTAFTMNAQIVNKKRIYETFNDKERKYHFRRRNKMSKTKKQNKCMFVCQKFVHYFYEKLHKFNSFCSRSFYRKRKSKKRISFKDKKIIQNLKKLNNDNKNKFNAIIKLKEQNQEMKEEFNQINNIINQILYPEDINLTNKKENSINKETEIKTLVGIFLTNFKNLKEACKKEIKFLLDHYKYSTNESDFKQSIEYKTIIKSKELTKNITELNEAILNKFNNNNSYLYEYEVKNKLKDIITIYNNSEFCVTNSALLISQYFLSILDLAKEAKIDINLSESELKKIEEIKVSVDKKLIEIKKEEEKLAQDKKNKQEEDIKNKRIQQLLEEEENDKDNLENLEFNFSDGEVKQEQKLKNCNKEIKQKAEEKGFLLKKFFALLQF